MISHLKDFKRSFVMGASAAILMALISVFLPDYFRSEARILPSEAKTPYSGGLGALSNVMSGLGINLQGGQGDDANFVDILRSRWLRERLLVTPFQFRARSWRFGKEYELRETTLRYLNAKDMEEGLRKLENVMDVNRDLKSKIIMLTAETKSPILSQCLVRRSIDLLEEFVQGKGRTRGGAKALFAEERLKETRTEMDRAERDLVSFTERNRNYLQSTEPTVRLEGMRLEADFKLKQQVVTALALNREQALMEEKNDIPVVNVMDPGSLPLRKSWPRRSMLAVLAFLILFLGTLGWSNRAGIKDFLRAE